MGTTATMSKVLWFSFLIFMRMHVCVCRRCVQARALVYRSEDNLQELVLSFYEETRDQCQAFRLTGRCLHLLSKEASLKKRILPPLLLLLANCINFQSSWFRVSLGFHTFCSDFVIYLNVPPFPYPRATSQDYYTTMVKMHDLVTYLEKVPSTQ